MKAGRYYIGDLTSILPTTEQHLLTGDDSGDDSYWAILPNGNQIFVAYSDAGNGIYLDNFDIEYLVTNYHIGVINLNDIPVDNLKNVGKGNVVEFFESFNVKFENGELILNDDIVIPTNSYNDEYLLAKLLHDSDIMQYGDQAIQIVDYDLDGEVMYGLNDDTNEDVELSFSEIDLEVAMFYKLEQVW